MKQVPFLKNEKQEIKNENENVIILTLNFHVCFRTNSTIFPPLIKYPTLEWINPKTQPKK